MKQNVVQKNKQALAPDDESLIKKAISIIIKLDDSQILNIMEAFKCGK